MSEGQDRRDGAADPAEATQARLRGLADLPIADHVAVFAEVHRELNDALRDSGPEEPEEPEEDG